MIAFCRKTALFLSLLLVVSVPALAMDIAELIASLEAEYAVIPDLSSAFGSDGIEQGEVFAVDIITGRGTLYADNGAGFDAADLVLLQRGFSVSAQIVAGHDSMLYEMGDLRVLILPQILPGKTLVITEDNAGVPSEPSEPTPAPSSSKTSQTKNGAAVIRINGKGVTLSHTDTLVSDIYTEATFSDGKRHLILGLPTEARSGDVIQPEYVLTQSECYPYITYIDENNAEWYVLAWNEPVSVASDLSIVYAVKMEPCELTDYMIRLHAATDSLFEGVFTATLSRIDSPGDSMDLSCSFCFEYAAP